MGKHQSEEGSNSESSTGSLQEITADDFKIRDGRDSSRSRVWMNDLLRYSASRNFNQDLYSFAWAQAVQNKPLGFDVKRDDDDDEIEMFVEDENDEKEGELEEGEIGFGSEPTVNLELKNEEKKVEEKSESEEKVEEIGEFDRRVGVILEELDTITEEEAESSFDEVCSRLQKSFASLKQMFSEGHSPVLDALAQQAFMGIQTVYSAFSSGNLKKMDQDKELLLRLLIHIKNRYSVLLTSEQVKEIDIRVHTLASEDVTIGKTGNVSEVSSGKSRLGPIGNNSVSNIKLEIPTNFRNKVDFSPLLNLHADYDEDSLPSPTRDSAPPLPVLKPIGIGAEATVTNHKNAESENGTFHPYVTDAFKAVSSYQQKYGKTSIFVSNDLPSPTPSEDGNGGGGGIDDDTHGEVSSSSVASNVRNVKPINVVANPQLAPVKTVEPNPVVKSSAKSRDPRLRFMNSQGGFVANSRKHKASKEPAIDDHNLKRQRNGSTSARDVQVKPNENMLVGSRNTVNGEVGPDRRLDTNNNFNGSNGGSVANTSTSTVPAVSLPSLLKGIAVNPTMLMQLVKMEQQRMAAEGQQKVAGSVGNVLPIAPNNASIKPLEVGKQPTAKPQMPQQSTPINTQKDAGIIRMKPRDPRRILHTNIVQTSEGSAPEPPKISVPPQSDMKSNNDRLTVREQGEQAQQAIVPSQSTVPKPDIKNLKNHADTISQPSPSKISNNPTEPKTQGGSTANPWGDVDHLLDGYDDQQKAAIQKERARRIEEQNKMFAARKLCLVLDLDHTLLNSAKFVEVDPAHEEILRKKDEQDREKPQRHLFRFQHMGMWTKLRPGIWNFLEKASKLYELHLYTMGNKLYATEMAKVLDPTGALFAGRVISRGDDGDPLDGDERVPKNKDLDGVLGMESAVVIIDDSVRVWPHNKLNLIVVERYTYFPCSRRQFGLLGPSLLEIDHDERPEAGTLASSLGVIERIHQNFFSHQSLNEVDVRNILASEQRKILGGCKIVFSRVFPVGEANPHLHPLWQTAEQFGAECTNQIDEQVTHVVANSLGTDKVNWALSTGRFVVHPGWVEASALLYRRANEQDFAVKL